VLIAAESRRLAASVLRTVSATEIRRKPEKMTKKNQYG
jgi:hypothetical protein